MVKLALSVSGKRIGQSQ